MKKPVMYEYEGRMVSAQDLSKITCRCIKWVRRALKRYKTIEELVEESFYVRKDTLYSYGGVVGTIKDMMKFSEVPYSTLHSRLDKGVPIERALRKDCYKKETK